VKLKLDENLSRHLKVPLATLGHDVQTAADEGLLSKPDPAVFKSSAAEGRMPKRSTWTSPTSGSTLPGRIPESSSFAPQAKA
jgi:hypothetical protein